MHHIAQAHFSGDVRESPCKGLSAQKRVINYMYTELFNYMYTCIQSYLGLKLVRQDLVKYKEPMFIARFST